MRNTIIRTITQLDKRTPLDVFAFPAKVWSGAVTQISDCKYKIANLGGTAANSLLDQEVLLKRENIGRMVTLSMPENSKIVGNEYHFEYDGVDIFEGRYFEVFTMKGFDLYAMKDWKSATQDRYTEALIDLSKLQWKTDPLGNTVRSIRAFEQELALWEEIEVNFLLKLEDSSFKPEVFIPPTNGQGNPLTPENIREEIVSYKTVVESLSGAVKVAVERELTPTISSEQVKQQERLIETKLICGTLGLPNDDLISSLSSEQIHDIWVDIRTLLNQEEIEPEPELVTEPAQKNTSTRGNKTKKPSIELTENSESSLEPDASISETLETSVLEQ
jgi:hypothetical protein